VPLVRRGRGGQADRMPRVPENLTCAGCGRPGTAGDAAGGWSLSSEPRATGQTARTPAQERITALCPECARGAIRDLEARLGP